ncbi:MAG: UDP-2,4-diacetamido-2,4,6-trideoxy-beta-L-altropyranose hydrolase [Methylophilaceae bacterium]
MNVVFRVDASAQIGTGHVMRCLTLAERLADKQDTQIFFVCRYLPPNLEATIRQRGYTLFMLPEEFSSNEKTMQLTHSAWLGVSQAIDAVATLECLHGGTYEWLVVDHYALDIRWERELRSAVKKIMVIDDIADRAHDCDILLDQNLHADQETRYTDKLSKQAITLLGPRYTLLRKEFGEYHERVKNRANIVSSILNFFGGVDADDYTSKTIKALSQITGYQFLVDVVIGNQHPNIKAVENLCLSFGYRCYVQTDKMAELIAKADLAIGAGGGAVWERACLGLPALAIPTAHNQVKQLHDLALIGVTYTFDADDCTVEKIKLHAEALIQNKALRKLLSIKSLEIVDGNGAYRVAQYLQSELEIQLRQATPSDERALFEWRNHATIRAASFNKNEIAWQQHHDWFTALLSDANKLLLIGESRNQPVGVVRFDLQGDTAEISIYLVPQESNHGLGIPLIKSAEVWITKNRNEIKTVTAHVLESNELSQRFFVKAGYTLHTKTYCKEL